MWYVDTAAALKLVIDEEHSPAMRSWAAANPGLVTSDLLRTELPRAVRRSKPTAMIRARELLESVSITTLPPETFEHAGELEPPTLRSLDAIHVAAALRMGDDLDGIVTYDVRLAEAARRYGLAVESPGAPEVGQR